MRNEREDNKWKHPPHIIGINIMCVATILRQIQTRAAEQ